MSAEAILQNSSLKLCAVFVSYIHVTILSAHYSDVRKQIGIYSVESILMLCNDNYMCKSYYSNPSYDDQALPNNTTRRNIVFTLQTNL